MGAMTQPSTQMESRSPLDQQAALAWLSQGHDRPAPAPLADATVEERRFLRFSLGLGADADTALLPLDSIQEVSQIPQRSVLPVPEVPDAVFGIANCRGAILWLVDLLQLLGQPNLGEAEASLEHPDSLSGALGSGASSGTPINSPSSVHAGIQFFHTLTIQAAGQSIGLVVPRVMDIEVFDAQALHPPAADLFPGYLLPFLAGYLQRSPVLSASALIENLQLQR